MIVGEKPTLALALYWVKLNKGDIFCRYVKEKSRQALLVHSRSELSGLQSRVLSVVYSAVLIGLMVKSPFFVASVWPVAKPDLQMQQLEFSKPTMRRINWPTTLQAR